jgi:S-disulfanyl-L-cysteine oxidoreductase SoxD
MMFGTILKALIAPIGLTAIVSWSAAGAPQQAAAGTSPRSVWDGVYTKQQAERGIELYATHCRSCHGESLEGNGPAQPLAGPVFTANWDGVSMGDMLERTRTSMPIDKPGSLSRQQVADVLAFVLSANKLPAGEVELPRQAEILNQIRFLATKPSDPMF